jgi:hypothetical protein
MGIVVVREALRDEIKFSLDCTANQLRETTMEESIFQFLDYAHLPENLQAISNPFGELAKHIVETLPRNPERTVALRKLLEAKDAAVRAQIFK